MGRTHRFGPGSREELGLEIRNHNLEVRLSGSYTVYCGNGWDHRLEIDTDWQPMGSMIVLTEDAIADRLLEPILDAWSDPCNEPDEEVTP